MFSSRTPALLVLLALLSLGLSACTPKEEAEPTINTFGAENLPSVATTPSPTYLSPSPTGAVANAPITAYANFAPGSQEALRAEAGDRIFFSTDSAALDSRAEAVLREVARWILSVPDRSLTIEGHADERGTREYNIALGERRAHAVRSFLTRQGVPAGRMSTISYGKERPDATGSSPQSWALNRRAVFLVR